MKTSALYVGIIFAADQVSAFSPSSLSHNLPNLHKRKSHQPRSSLRPFTNQQRQYEDLNKSTSLHAIPIPGLSDVSSLTSTILSNTPPVPLPLSLLLNTGLFLVLKSKLSKLLTPEGYYHSLALGTLLWHTLGWMGWSTCVLYLGLGSLVTKVKMAEKEEMGIAEGRGGRRGPENVWGSAATALLLAAASLQVLPTAVGGSAAGKAIGQFASYDLLILGYVSSLATKLADTFASEIGKAYGKTTFLITTFERADPGTEGAVSLEGTLAAAVGGSLLPIYAVGIGFLKGGVGAIGVATLAAFLATNAESLIGATLQGKKGFEWMTNEVVNFFNTVIGAGIAIGVGKILF